MTAVLLSEWRFRALLISILVAVVGYGVFSFWGGIEHVGHAFAVVGVMGFSVTLSLSLVNYALRFIRWQIYFRALGHSIPWRPNARIYLAGFALTTTPGKAGEALRGVLLKAWDVPYSRSFAAFISERLSDLVAIVLLTLLGLVVYPEAYALMAAGVFAVIFGLWLVSNEKLLARLQAWSGNSVARSAKAIHHVAHVLLEARRCHSLDVLLPGTLLSVVAWSAEAYAFYLLLGWMGYDIALPFAMFVYAVAMLAGALSFLPGGLGGAEAVMVGLLVWKGVATPDAVAATVLIRLATLWFAVALGVVALMLSQNPGRAQ